MELGLVKRRKRWLLILAAMGASGYGVYRVYNSPSVATKRKRLMRVLEALISTAEMVADSAETIGIVSNDLKDFLNSDSDEMPQSLKQISKIARSNEFSESLSKCTEAMTVGIYRGFRFEMNNGAVESGKGLGDRVLDKVFSKAGTGFVSVVVGSFARNLVLGFYSSVQSGDKNLTSFRSNSSDVPTWVNVVCSDKSKEVIADCIRVFVSTAVAAYLDRTKDINIFDEMCDGLTNPKHQEKMRELLVSVCNGAVESVVKTSHQVLTSPTSSSSSNLPSWSVVDESLSGTRDECLEKEASSKCLKDGSSLDDMQHSGWIGRVSSTLAVPSNRKFVLDVAGRVTFETVRSFVEYMVWMFVEGLKRSVNVLHGEIVGRGLQVIRYFGAKSSAIVTLCLALYLYVLGGTRILLTA